MVCLFFNRREKASQAYYVLTTQGWGLIGDLNLKFTWAPRVVFKSRLPGSLLPCTTAKPHRLLEGVFPNILAGHSFSVMCLEVIDF